MTTDSSILAWKIPWTEEPQGLQSMGSQELDATKRRNHQWLNYHWRVDINEGLSFLTEKAMAPHSSTLAWKILWTEEPGGLQSMGSLRVRQDSATSLSLFTFMHWRRKWQPTPVFLPVESQGQGILSMVLHRVRHNWSDLAAAEFFLKEMSGHSNFSL